MEAVCDNTCPQSSAEQAGEAVRVEDHTNSLGVGNWDLVGLLGGLDYAQTVAAAIGYNGGCKANEGVTAKLLKSFVRVRLRDVLLQGVEGEEPGKAVF